MASELALHHSDDDPEMVIVTASTSHNGYLDGLNPKLTDIANDGRSFGIMMLKDEWLNNEWQRPRIKTISRWWNKKNIDKALVSLLT